MQEIIFNPEKSARILVVGDIILDQYIYGETSRISPEAPVPVVQVKDTEERPGGAANVAVNVSALGMDVKLLGVTGKDDAADRLRDVLNQQGVACHFIYQQGIPTITKRRVLSQHQQLLRLDYERDTVTTDNDELLDEYKRLIDTSDIVILSDYAKGSLNQVAKLIDYARSKSVTVLVDPKSKDFSCYSNASMLTPNQKEFEAVVGECNTDDQLINKGQQLRDRLNLSFLLVTRGEKGMLLLSADESPLHLKAETHEVYDVTGAGDTVIAVLAAAMASGHPVKQATTIANRAAGLVVEKLGAATVTIDEINGISEGIGTTTGIVDEETGLRLVQQAKQNGKRTIMTNGCFDLLHVGHIAYLSEAKSMGDVLIVAVNSDDSVKRLKGNERPINNLENRMTVLNALASVDLVIPFSEDTPERLIALLKPDVLVKGGDYTEEQIAGARYVREAGGDVVVLPYQEGLSTSLTLQKIKNDAQESL